MVYQAEAGLLAQINNNLFFAQYDSFAPNKTDRVSVLP